MSARAPAPSHPIGASSRGEEVVEVEAKGGPTLCGSIFCPGWLPAPAGRGVPPRSVQEASLPSLLAGKSLHKRASAYQGASKVPQPHWDRWEQGFCDAQSLHLGEESPVWRPARTRPATAAAWEQFLDEEARCYALVVSGSSVQASKMGTYFRTDVMQSGRTVFKLHSGSDAAYMFFWEPEGRWYIGPDYSKNTGWLHSTGTGKGAPWPADASKWQHYDGSSFTVADGITVVAQECVDLTGHYVYSGPKTGTDSLTQSGCQGSSDDGSTYTVNGRTVTMDATGVTGSISGSIGAYIITWSNGYVYTAQATAVAALDKRDAAPCFLGRWCFLGRKTSTAEEQGPAAIAPPAPQVVRLSQPTSARGPSRPSAAAGVSPRPEPQRGELSRPSAAAGVAPRLAVELWNPPPQLAASAQEPCKPEPSGPSRPSAAPGVPMCPTCKWVCRCPNCRPKRKALPAMLVNGPSPADLPDEILNSIFDLDGDHLSEKEVERLLMRWAELVGVGQCIDVLSSEKSLRVIIKAMRRWPFDKNTQLSGCYILSSVAALGEKQCMLIASLDGVAAVVEALKTHMHTAEAVELKEKGCWALRQLSMESQCRREVLVQQGLEIIVDVLRRHPDAPGVLESACMALANLAADPDPRIRIAQVGGVEAVVRTMAPNVDSSVLQEAACLFLHNIACTSEYHQLIVESGGFEAAVTAMRAHPDHASLQEGGCGVFHNVANGPTECLEAVSKCSAVEAVIEAMRAHPAHAGVQEKACHALAQMGDVHREVVQTVDRRLHDKIVALGGAEALQKAKANFRRDAAATHEAEEALSVLEL